MRIALANLRFPTHPAESVALAVDAIREAAAAQAQIVCFPECYVPGYRSPGKNMPPPNQMFQEQAWSKIAEAAPEVTVILGTERIVAGALLATAAVIQNGAITGFQDKVQLDPSEEETYTHGQGRRIFQSGAVKFGIAICHEGWRYPETFRHAARQGAHIVFHPQFHEREPGAYQPVTYADPLNTFHEKALLCRAAENTCYVATVNVASPGSPTTSAVVNPDGTLLCYQPYGQHGLLLADIDPAKATCLLASRLRNE